MQIRKTNSSNIAKGLAIGALAGYATYALTSSKKTTAKAIKKNASRAMKSVGHVVDNMSYMMK